MRRREPPVSIASVHVSDVGARRGLRMLRGPGRVPGLLSSETAAAAPLRSGPLAVPMPGRIALIGFWESHEALDAFVRDHPYAGRMASGWWARLEPERAHGAWPGLDRGVARSRVATEPGAVAVITFGRLRLRRAPQFLRASRPAEGAAVSARGFRWGTALARPPFVATLSLWESAGAAAAYAYGGGGPHSSAIDADRR